ARMGQDTNLIFATFKSLYIPSDIIFMLATRYPQGNCTNGIVRHFDSRTTWKQADANCNSCTPYWAHTWDPTMYLNIYVVNSIVSSGTVTGGGIIVGYTFRPGTWGTQNAHDAVVYNASHLTGSQAGIPNARSLTHEIGHWLDLAHTFGNTNNPGVICGSLGPGGGDGIADTPDTKGNFGTCPASSTNTAYTCTSPNPTNSANYYQNVHNFMDYSSCARNFTQGQTTRMRNTLTSNVSGRSNLITSTNLAATNVNGNGLCKPVCDFISTNCSYTVCAGSSITMRDLSYNGTVTAYQWSADNGAVIANATGTVTSINFPNVGSSVVSLTVTNPQGSDVLSRTVTVLDGSPSILGPYMESFENPGVPQDWSVVDGNNDSYTWAQTPLASYDAFQSFMVEGFNLPANSVEILQMPTMDVLNNSQNDFTFAYSYRQATPTQNDELKVQASSDCGGTWGDIVTFTGSQMQVQCGGGVSTDPFYPSSVEWATYSIPSHPNWQNYVNSTHVIVRFVFKEGTVGGGNNMFIDAVDFGSGAVGINELTNEIGLNMYPNPTNDKTNLRFNLNDPANIKISVYDLLGKELLTVVDQKYPAGEQIITINENNVLSKGVYFVNMSYNGTKLSAKLVIN
ncbi:MAG: T9SS type A sorting domain-containing protein, partial [Bacteroidia bacterium]|nr:T9SS type A sorting domain-containing protein [Bacteroidia bacterium]